MVRAPKPKPDPDQPGRFLPNGKAAKAGLNRGIYAKCWGLITQRLEDKTSASGTALVYVPAVFSSLQCRTCGHSAKGNRKSQAEFRCAICGHPARAHLRAGGNTHRCGCASTSEKTQRRPNGIRNPATFNRGRRSKFLSGFLGRETPRQVGPLRGTRRGFLHFCSPYGAVPLHVANRLCQRYLAQDSRM